jgi:hypothetical protein
MGIFVKFVKLGAKDLMLSQKTGWRARHRMNIVDGKKTQVKTQKCINFGEIW